VGEREQGTPWRRQAGNAWVELQGLIDGLLAPMERALVEQVREVGARAVLDVGCGTGGTTVALAREVGDDGAALGVDVSEPMIAAARERAARERSRARFVVADAQRHDFAAAERGAAGDAAAERGAAGAGGDFDAVVSRFGVMFFDDPHAAFANLRRAGREGAALRCVVWRTAEENPFMTTAERAVRHLLPQLPERPPEGPGQFAFGDPDRVRAHLAGTGWEQVELRRLDLTCAMPAAELTRYLTHLGPVGLALAEVDDERLRARVAETARAAFAPYERGDEVRFTAACWMLAADAR